MILVFRDVEVNHRIKRLWFTGYEWDPKKNSAKIFDDKELSNIKAVFGSHKVAIGYEQVTDC